MTRKIKIIISIVGAVAAIVILTVLIVVLKRPAPNEIKETNQKISQTTANVFGSSGGLQKILDNIMVGGDVGNCVKAGFPEAIDRCYFFIAAARSDLKLCEQIADVTIKSSCFGAVTVQNIKKSKKWDDCVTIADASLRQDCILIAVNEGVKDDFCAKFSNQDNSFCLERLKFIKGLSGDKASCERLSDQGLRAECLKAIAAE